jgi:hypothetical protein
MDNRLIFILVFSSCFIQNAIPFLQNARLQSKRPVSNSFVSLSVNLRTSRLYRMVIPFSLLHSSDTAEPFNNDDIPIEFHQQFANKQKLPKFLAKLTVVCETLKQFRAQYGNSNVPSSFVVPSHSPWDLKFWGFKLGLHVGLIRKCDFVPDEMR